MMNGKLSFFSFSPLFTAPHGFVLASARSNNEQRSRRSSLAFARRFLLKRYLPRGSVRSRERNLLNRPSRSNRATNEPCGSQGHQSDDRHAERESFNSGSTNTSASSTENIGSCLHRPTSGRCYDPNCFGSG